MAETILIVDDEETDRSYVRKILEGQGYPVLEGNTYRDGWRVFDANREAIDLMILDVSLPGGNGCELAIAIRKQKPDIRVLFVSGYVGAEVCRFYGLELSDWHFLRKPFTPADLLSRMKQVLQSEDPFPRIHDPLLPDTPVRR